MRLPTVAAVGFILSSVICAADTAPAVERIDIGVTQDLLDVSVVENALTIVGQKGTLAQTQLLNNWTILLFEPTRRPPSHC